jgi:hypothetical protein
VQTLAESLQRQIHALKEVIRVKDQCGTPLGPGPAALARPNSRDIAMSEPRPMSKGHPLREFVDDRLAEMELGRARCGAVRRAYILWQKQTCNGKPGLHHITFSQEMKKYWLKKGCPGRSYYHGVELKPLCVTSPAAVATTKDDGWQ